MAHFGINADHALGVHIPEIRKIAKSIGKDHALALDLWRSQIKEARILASMVDDPGMVTESQMEIWCSTFDSWDLCDQCCSNLFDKTQFAYSKAAQWSKRNEEYVKRAGFALMACLAVHDKAADDARFVGFLAMIQRESWDERNFVKKAVNWALRQIGKRNVRLNKEALACAKLIRQVDSPSAKWIASDAIRELSSKAVLGRLHG